MSEKHFTLDMTIAQAMEVNPNVAQVFAAFHLGGCAHCYINRIETLEQVCAGYNIDPNQLLEGLESVMEPSEA